MVEHPTDTRAVVGSTPTACTEGFCVYSGSQVTSRESDLLPFCTHDSDHICLITRYTGGMRNIFTTIGVALLVAGVALIFFFVQNKDSESSASQTQSAAAIVPFERIAHGARSAVKERVNYAISSPEQMVELWEMLDKSDTPPAVDFNRQMVIAVFAGEKPAIGYGISVSKVTDADKRLVAITLESPADKCASKSTSTTPYEIVVVPTASLPLAHQDTLATVACPE